MTNGEVAQYAVSFAAMALEERVWRSVAERDIVSGWILWVWYGYLVMLVEDVEDEDDDEVEVETELLR